MSVTELDQLRNELKELRIEHRQLDIDIHELQRGPHDQFDLRRLKKRKLFLKDMIVRLESQLIPDLNAWKLIKNN